MSQAPMTIPNLAGSGFRAALNDALAALVGNNSGSEEPSETHAYMWWADAANGRLKMRNAANSGWVDMMPFNLMISSFAASLLDDADAAAMRNTLGAFPSAGGTFAGNVNVPSLNDGQLAGYRNAIINGNFGVNQRSVSGTVTLAAGAYGHDYWKAGSGGCTYTFTTTNNVTTINIIAGTLVQVIEGANLHSGARTLSWTGTAQGRIDGGTYGASGIAGTAVGGTNQIIEFNAGTLSRVQYEPGTVATTFELRPISTEQRLCRWRCRSISALGLAASANLALAAGNNLYCVYSLSEPMRATPTVSSTATWTVQNVPNPTITPYIDKILLSAVSTVAGNCFFLGTGGQILLSSDL